MWLDKGRKTLVIDLDETLVHSSFEPMKITDLIVEVSIKLKKGQYEQLEI